jgi:rubrerythrin
MMTLEKLNSAVDDCIWFCTVCAIEFQVQVRGLTAPSYCPFCGSPASISSKTTPVNAPPWQGRGPKKD